MTDATNKLVTTILAWTGGILAIPLAVLKVIEFARDRAKVVVSYKANMQVLDSPLYDPEKDYVVVTVTNKGRRPVTITKVGGVARDSADKSFMLADSGLFGSRELTENKSTVYLCEQDGIDFSRLRCFSASDMIGREYRCKIRKQDRRSPKGTATTF